LKKEERLALVARGMVAEFFQVVQASGVPVLVERAKPVLDALEDQRLHIQIPPDDPGTPLSGAEFILDGGNKPALLVRTAFMKLYPRHKSFVFAVLMHETAHASDYLRFPDGFFRQRKDGIERYLYEMDAAYVEGLFIREVSKPRGWKLSPFEGYLLQSLDKDNLKSYSTAFLMTDMSFVYTYYKAREGSEPLDTLAASFVAWGRRMKADFLQCKEGDEWTRYQALVSIRTFVVYGSELAATLVSRRQPNTDPHDTIDKHVPGFDAVILDLQDLLQEHEKILDLRGDLMRRFNAAF